MTASPEQIFRRVPPSTIRLEEEVRHGQPVLLAVPSMRVVATSAAPEAIERVRQLLAARRRDLTRPDGTCSRCSGPLQAEGRLRTPDLPEGVGWCDACYAWVRRAGPR